MTARFGSGLRGRTVRAAGDAPAPTRHRLLLSDIGIVALRGDAELRVGGQSLRIRGLAQQRDPARALLLG